VVARTQELKRFWDDGTDHFFMAAGGRYRNATANRRTGGILDRESIVPSDKGCINDIGVDRALGMAAIVGERDEPSRTGQPTAPFGAAPLPYGVQTDKVSTGADHKSPGCRGVLE
jgi:hypothetical protein